MSTTHVFLTVDWDEGTAFHVTFEPEVYASTEAWPLLRPHERAGGLTGPGFGIPALAAKAFNLPQRRS